MGEIANKFKKANLLLSQACKDIVEVHRLSGTLPKLSLPRQSKEK